MTTSLKKVASSVSGATMLSIATVHNALAQPFGEVPDVTETGEVDGDSIRTTVLDIIQDVLSFMALVAVVVIIIAGIRLVVGGADEQQREKARNTVLYAVIGLILILLAQAIVGFVNSFVTN